MLRKEYAILRCSIDTIFSNKLRFLLSILGIVLSSLIFTIGIIGINIYYNNQYSKYDNYMSDTIVVDGHINDQLYNQIVTNTQLRVFPYSQLASGIFLNTLTNDEKIINITTEVIGTTYNFEEYLVPNYSNDKTVSSYQLIKGRTISITDIEKHSPVAVLDTFTVNLLFQGEDPIGKIVKVPIIEEKLSKDGFVEPTVTHFKDIEIIGVVANPVKQMEQELDLKNAYQSTDQIHVNTVMYVPYTLFSYVTGTTASSQIFDKVIIHMYNPDNSGALYNDLLHLVMNSDSANATELYTKDMLFYEITNSLKNTKSSLYLIILFIIFVIGIIIMNTMFFSVKERISEIGIKKALGATSHDITIHFLIESSIIGVIGSLLGTLVGLIGSVTIVTWMKITMVPHLAFSLDSESILLIILICASQSIIFTIIPALYGSRIKIVDAIRFE